LMRAIHLVRSRRDGRQIFYSLDDQHVVDLFQRSLAHVRHLTEKETEHFLE
jgi:ArsR family transcriptional regulator